MIEFGSVQSCSSLRTSERLGVSARGDSGSVSLTRAEGGEKSSVRRIA
jgi:hypothetical protein